MCNKVCSPIAVRSIAWAASSLVPTLNLLQTKQFAYASGGKAQGQEPAAMTPSQTCSQDRKRSSAARACSTYSQHDGSADKHYRERQKDRIRGYRHGDQCFCP